MSKFAELETIPVYQKSEGKIYVREQFGRFQAIRRKLSSVLLAIFILIPFLQFNGEQAVLFDVKQQTLTLFYWVLYPQDLFIFALVFIAAAYGLFWVTRKYGRVWCGYTCPQTIWSLMFMWVENRVIGSRNQQISLDKQPWSVTKVSKKSAVYVIWAMIALITALVFMSYFIPVGRLYPGFFSLSLTGLETGWVLFFATCTFVNAGFIREKMCEHMCPYSRFQSAMFQPETRLVTYDVSRGEGRGPRRRNQTKPNGMGDCVDCKLCVQVCPAGIDIREGLQAECINCGLCVDACNDVMTNFGYQPNLIRYQAQAPSLRSPKMTLGYAAGVLLVVIAMVAWTQIRSTMELSVLRDRNALYRTDYLGNVENTYTLKLLNKSRSTEFVELVAIRSDDGKELLRQDYEINAQEQLNVATALTMHDSVFAQNNKTDVVFTVTEKDSNEVLSRKQTVFYGPSFN